MLSKKTKYGIKALTFIARQEKGSKITIASISKFENISHKFLESILLILKNHEILSSKKGKGGGYYLAKNPSEIIMTDVIRALEGPIAMVSCVSLNYYKKCDDCPNENQCSVHQLMLQVRDSTLSVLKNTTLAELL